MYYASYDRRNEPGLQKLLTVSLAAGASATLISQPFEFLKTKIQIYNEGIGFTGRRMDMGYNQYHVLKNFLK